MPTTGDVRLDNGADGRPGFAVTLDFGAPREIRHVGMGFLQDTGSWIFMPRRIFLEASDDGRIFRPLGTIENTTPEREAKVVTRTFAIDFARPRQARYLRMRVTHYGRLPAWHPGAGQNAWLFADEIVVR